ncbi:MAG: TolC family protein [Candidatus Symbiothrix sp.]|jgi:outer membrane protein TolC|nr:TolC family protein [Candidatus Symbiothrix sp.]
MKLVLGKKMTVMAITAMCVFSSLSAQNVATQQVSAAPLTLSLEDAITIALSDNPTIKIADQEIERVDYSKKSAWQGLLPTLDGTGQYGKYAVPGTMSLAGMKIDMPTDWTVSLGLQLALPLVAPGLWKSIQLSELEMKMAIEKARASKITLRNEVTKAYYNILLAQDSYKVLQEGYDLAKKNYDQAKQRFEVGLVAEYDYISAEVQMTNLQPNLLQVENGITQAKLYLKVLMGVNMSVPLSVKGNLADYENEVFGLNGRRDIELTNNTDLQQLDIQQQQADKAIDLQRTQFMPTLGAFGTYTYAGQASKASNSLFGDRPASTDWFGQGLIVGLQLNVPIFHATTHTKLKQLKIQANELKIQRDYLENSLTVQARTSLDNMDKAKKQVEAAKKATTLAQKSYDISAKRYETGMGIMIELNSASLAVTQAQLAYQQAISDYLTAKADLEKTLGLD